jgi:polyferredoxin
MASAITRALQALEMEEKILNAALLMALSGLFLPWVSGEWLGEDAVSHSGFGFFTSFLGVAIFLLLVFLLAITFLPLFGGSERNGRRKRQASCR